MKLGIWVTACFAPKTHIFKKIQFREDEIKVAGREGRFLAINNYFTPLHCHLSDIYANNWTTRILSVEKKMPF